MKFFAVFALSCIVALTEGVVVRSKEFKRLIPRDRLRDFPQTCFASTQCKVFKEDESWSLAPFCGLATCTGVNQTVADGKVVKVLAEQVTDCGPLIDLPRTPGCQPIPLTEEAKGMDFPGCCPMYDCEEGTKIFYVGESPAEPKSLS